MRTLEDQIRDLATAAEDSWSPIDSARFEVSDDVQPLPGRSVPGRVRLRPSLAIGAVAIGAAVAFLGIGLIPLLTSGTDDGVTSAPTTIQLSPETTSPTSPPTSNPLAPAPEAAPATPLQGTALPLGSFSWEFVERPEGTVPPKEWPGRLMASTSTGYHFWISCEQYEPAGSSFIWSSPDGIAWNRQRIPCDDTAFGVADKLILASFTRREAFISDDGRDWTLLTTDGPTDGPSGSAVRGGPLWHGSENGYSPGALIWEIDDIGVMYDFSMPWGIGGYAPTGWLFEFDSGLTAISRCCQTEWLREPMVKHSTDNHTWIDAPQPPFVEAGYNLGTYLWSTFAHQDGIAVAAASNGTDTTLWRTIDGLEWTDVTPSAVPSGGVWAADTFWVQGLDFFSEDTLGDFINLSADGTNWTATDIPPEVASFKGTVRIGSNKIFVFGDQLLIGTYNPPQGL